MDILLHDARLRVVLRQLPRFFSTSVPLGDKLEDLCEAAVEVLNVDSAAVVLFDEILKDVISTSGAQPEMIEALSDSAAVHAALERSEVAAHGGPGWSGLLTPLRGERGDFGALLVARHGKGSKFTPDDASLLDLFTQAVGPSIHHGIRMLSTERAERWGAASVQLVEQFMAEEDVDPYTAVVDAVWGLAEAEAVGIVMPRENRLDIHKVRGLGMDELSGQSLPFTAKYALEIMRRGRGMIADDELMRSAWPRAAMPEAQFGPGMAVPLKGTEGPLGVLFVARRYGGPMFLQDDLQTAETFAVNAAVAMQWHAARQSQEELRMLQERNRIARDLHDNVVQRLFATGLYLQQASRTLEGEERERVLDAMTAVDQTIRQIRNTILVLRSTAADRLDHMLTTIVTETTPLLGFSPRVAIAADVDQVTGPLAADLALCLREALSNVVQHAKATKVDLRAGVENSHVVLALTDNGVGIQAPPRPGGGLENLDERARAHGGTFTYCSDSDCGTTLQWRMPLVPD